MKTVIYKAFEHSSGYSLDGGVPMLVYVYMGIAPNTLYSPGWYTGHVEKIYNESEYNSEKALEIAKPILVDRLAYFRKHPIYTINFFAEKLGTTWLNPTFQVLWCSTPGKKLEQLPRYNEYVMARPFINSILCGRGYDVIEKIFDIFQIIAYLSAGFGVYKFSKDTDCKFLLIPIIMLGGFVFHFIWETKAIYVIQYFYILIPFSAYGICEFIKYFENNKLKQKNR